MIRRSSADALGIDAPGWLQQGLAHLWLPYTQMKTAPAPLPVTDADGVYLGLADGTRLVDGVASWWTAVHGYRHRHIVHSVHAQLDRMAHVMLGGLVHEQASRLASRLAAILPGSLQRVFFSESGSLSVEIGMKMAVQYWLNRGQRRHRFVSFLGGYHGDSFATMSVCDPQEGMHRMFTGVVPEQLVTALPVNPQQVAALDALLGRHAGKVAAVLVEPLVQGAGGMRFHDASVLRQLRELCDRHQVLLIFDEIFAGFARTGRALFACQAAGVTPDIITLSKALTGGTLPLAATIASEEVFAAFWDDRPEFALMHGPTYMGNALACAAANASLDLFESEPRVEQARQIEHRLCNWLAPAREIPGVRDVRVLGAIGVIQLDGLHDAAWLQQCFIDRGIWLRPFGDILYTTPPLVIGNEELHRIAEAMLQVTELWSARHRRAD